MGIRIHKELGWVLEGVDLNTEVLETLSVLDLKNENLNDKYLCQLDLMYPEIDLSEKLINFVNDISDEDSENDRLYIFSPPYLNKSWSRYNESIDYYDTETAERSIKYISREIYPYSNHFVVTKTLKPLTEVEARWCHYVDNISKLTPEAQEQLKIHGLNDQSILRSQIHMTCPRVLQLILEKCSKIDYKRLRPAIVVYWR